MARIEDLIASVESPALRDALAHEVKTLKQRTAFGLVFERHIPENALVEATAGLGVGDRVRLRSADRDVRDLRVLARSNGQAVLVDANGEQSEAAVADLFVVRGFGESVYPTLTTFGAIERGEGRPYHSVINGENYHALQLLAHCMAGQVDCIYIDPPYNTGARDWKYNNDYVDATDTWRHSKWLSMMEKRLRIARRLLKPDGVLIVTVDEHEVHHLGVLLEQLLPNAGRQLITIVNNPKGVTQPRFSRVEEYAYFCFRGTSVVAGIDDDLLTTLTEDEMAEGAKPRWKGLLRSGKEAKRQDRAGMFYPVLVDAESRAVVGVGEPLLPVTTAKGTTTWPAPDMKAKVDGLTAVWPIRDDLTQGRWSVGPQTLARLIDQGYVALGNYDKKRDTWGISYLSRQNRDQIAAGVLVVRDFDKTRNLVDVRYIDPQARRVKTVWHRTTHDAGAYGADLLRAFLGGERRFDYPKSLYAVRDTLKCIVGDRRDALIVDFFAGSATTLHATWLLNAEDDGRRRCVVVTNNEVSSDDEKELRAHGLRLGDPEWEAKGVFEHVARPRCTAALTGALPGGEPVSGSYLSGRPYSDGFAENCEFFRLDYLSPDEVELGRAFAAVHPLLWLMAGSRGSRNVDIEPSQPFAIADSGGYAVLFDEAALREFVAALKDAPGVGHVFLVTDSEDAFAEMCESIVPGLTPHMLYRDYLRSFRIQAAPPT